MTNKNSKIAIMDVNQTDLERKFGFMGQKESIEEIKKINLDSFGFKSMENKQIGTLFGML